MTTTLAPRAARHHQIPRANPAVLSDTERIEIRHAYLGVVAALRPRPEPREFWDDCARPADEALSRNAWTEKTVAKIREALVEAERQGPGALAATMDRVETFFNALHALAIRGFDPHRCVGLDTALVAATEDAASVTVAAAQLLHEKTEGNLEAVRFAAMEAIRQEAKVLDLASTELAALHAERSVARRQLVTTG